MENREQEILSEIKSMMASIRSQLERLDAKMAELQQVVDPEGFEANPIDIEIDEVEFAQEPVAVEPQEITLEMEEPLMTEEPVVETPGEEVLSDDDDLPFAEDPVKVPEPESEPEPEPEPEQESEPEPEPAEEPEKVPEEDDDDLPGIFDAPERVSAPVKVSPAAKPTINDAMAADQAWRTDMPGTPVRDIRSAISLNDRVIFINMLFAEDAQAFVDTLLSINTMETLEQVVEYVTSRYPQWDLNSELVYRFMMAVRRKVGR